MRTIHAIDQNIYNPVLIFFFVAFQLKSHSIELEGKDTNYLTELEQTWQGNCYISVQLKTLKAEAFRLIVH